MNVDIKKFPKRVPKVNFDQTTIQRKKERQSDVNSLENFLSTLKHSTNKHIKVREN